LRVSPLGIGTWAWGEWMWGYGRGYGEEDVMEAYRQAVRAGVNFFDTAEVYGLGRSERLLNQAMARHGGGDDLVIATKCFPYPWRLHSRALRRALRGSLRRLGRPAIDLYYMHWPLPPVSIQGWMEQMIWAFEEGLIKGVGVSNYNREQMLRARDVLARRGIPLAANQLPYSLLNRGIEQSGLLQTCAREGITVVAYSPLEQGFLTGKYGPHSPPPRTLARRGGRAYMQRLPELIGLMREIGHEHGGKTPAQVALNWAICKGTIPLAGAKNGRQAMENAGAMGWRLTASQIEALQAAAAQIRS
jgi:aryl-alcohol dehydrogenase-like predicted oxidoreductase